MHCLSANDNQSRAGGLSKTYEKPNTVSHSLRGKYLGNMEILLENNLLKQDNDLK